MMMTMTLMMICVVDAAVNWVLRLLPALLMNLKAAGNSMI